MTKPWSKLRSRVEALWVPALPMRIHATSYAHVLRHEVEHLPRHWITLDQAVVWDFPFPFIVPNVPKRGQVVGYYDDAYHVHDQTLKPIEPICTRFGRPLSSIVAILLRQYLDRPRAALFEPFEQDGWELTDMLRAADARVGRRRLAAWARTLDAGHPALAVVRRRLSVLEVVGLEHAVGQADDLLADPPIAR